jgi:hypothetical protein
MPSRRSSSPSSPRPVHLSAADKIRALSSALNLRRWRRSFRGAATTSVFGFCGFGTSADVLQPPGMHI